MSYSFGIKFARAGANLKAQTAQRVYGMAQLFHLIIILLAVFMVSNAAPQNQIRQDNRGRYNPYYNDPYYGRYYKNRDYYNNRQYYDNYYKNYKPDVSAPQARIVTQEVESNQNGVYSYNYETENGIHADEHGVAVKVGTDEQKEVVEGSYSFITPEGIRVIVRYTADENGFHPTISYEGPNVEPLVASQQPADVIIEKSKS